MHSSLIFAAMKNDSVTSSFNERVIVQPTPMAQVLFPYNQINTDFVSVTTGASGIVTGGAGLTGVTGGGTGTNSMAILKTSGGTGTTFATIASKARLSYRPGQGAIVVFSAIFNSGVANNFQTIGIGNSQDGFFFGYNGTAFGLLHRRASVDTWTAQASWNGDPVNGTGPSGITLNPQTGNIYKIQFQWLGYGVIKFFVQNPTDGSWILVHTIQYPNANTIPTLRNPSLQLYASVYNAAAGTATPVTLQTAGMGAFIEGQINAWLDSRFSVYGTKSLATGAGTTANSAIVSLLNNTTYQNVNNQVMIRVTELSLVATAITATTQQVLVSLFKNATVTGAAFTAVNANTSVASFDTAGTTISGGTLLCAFYVSGSTLFRTKVIDLSPMEIWLAPGDQLVCHGLYTAGAIAQTATVYAGFSWAERF